MQLPYLYYNSMYNHLTNLVSNDLTKHTISDSNRLPYAVKYNPGAEYRAAVADENGFLKLFRTSRSTLDLIKEASIQKNCIYDIAWLSQYELACGGGDQSVAIVDCNSFERVSLLRGAKESVKSVSTLRGNPFLVASGSLDGSVLIFDSRCNKKSDEQHTIGPINTISPAHISSSYVPALHGKSTRARSAALAAASAANRVSPVSAVLFFSDHLIFSSGATDSIIKLWDIRKIYHSTTHGKASPIDPVPLISFKNKFNGTKGYSCLALNHASTRLYATCMDSCIYEYDLANEMNLIAIGPVGPNKCVLKDEQGLSVFKKHKTSSNYIKSCVSLCDNFMLSGSSDSIGYVYPLRFRERLAPLQLESHLNEVTAVDWCPHDFNQLITCSDDNSVRVWNVKKDLSAVDQSKCDLVRARVYQSKSEAAPPSPDVGGYRSEVMLTDTDRWRKIYANTNYNNLLLDRKKRNFVNDLPKLNGDCSNEGKVSLKFLSERPQSELNKFDAVAATPKPVQKIVSDVQCCTSTAKKRTIDSLFNELLNLNSAETSQRTSKKRLLMDRDHDGPSNTENSQNSENVVLPMVPTAHKATPSASNKTPRARKTHQTAAEKPSSSLMTPNSKSILDYFSPRNLKN